MGEQAITVTMKGKPLSLAGTTPKVGAKAPDFTLVANDLSVVTLKDFAGKVLVLAAVPSLDTPVCDLETRTFNERAAGLGEDVLILTVSMDLPFAQKRWCGAKGVERVKTLSDYRFASFGEAYGVLIRDLRLLARSVFVIDREGKVRYAETVPEVTKEPNYDAVLRAAADASKSQPVRAGAPATAPTTRETSMATERLQVYKCEVCAIVAEVLDGGAGGLSCCGRPMTLLRENTVDASKEKHVPVIEKAGAGLTVKVGSVPHPMEEKHFIEWIEIIVGGKTQRQFLKPGEKPQATFEAAGDGVVAREYCNLHGLWTARK